MYEYVLFDLDGTIVDSAEGITNSVVYALKKFDIEATDKTALQVFIGPPLVDSFMKYYGFSKEEANRAVTGYREYYSTEGLYQNTVYDGVETMLQTIRDSGKKVILATSKPEKFAKIILAHYGLAKYFDFIGGASFDEKRSDKASVIAYVMTECGITDPSRVIMVGDREHDVLGAKAHGIDTVGVLYGYGTREELTDAGAVYIAESAADIAKYVI